METKVGGVDGMAKPHCNDVGGIPASSCHTITSGGGVSSAEATLGRHVARRLVQVGVQDIFAVPGDFNLTLLDHLIAEPELRLIGCCNELNAGYAADGYARCRGVGACVVTFTVGGLSVLNAIAGAYSENLPVICIVGGPNSNDFRTNRILHHTIGLPDFSQEVRCFQTVTCFQVGGVDGMAKPHCNDVGGIPASSCHTITPGGGVSSAEATLGRHVARRLVQVGVRDVFAVPGDFNLTLLDHLIAEPELRLIGCCNELNAGYAADGYARCRGVGACVVTFTVGGLSVLNAIAGAYSENLPVICIVGGPNSNDFGTSRILHHTIGLPDFSQEVRCFQTVTCFQAIVNNLEDAHEVVDTAISTAIKESKPVYISISCNLPGLPHPTFSRDPVPFSHAPRLSNQMGLEAAVEAAADFLNKAVKPVLVGGPKLRVAKARDAFVQLADSCGYPIAAMPSAKGLVPEHHPRFLGTYWGAVSTAFCAEIVESADAYLFAGPIFNDYSSVGYSLLLKKEKAIVAQPNRVVVANGPAFGCVLMKDFLSALAKRLKCNETAHENYRRIFVPGGELLECQPEEPLRVNVLFKHIQSILSGDTAVIAETGDSWFNCQKLKLPQGCGYEFQMQYGSIGWSVGATLGYAQAAKDKRVIACIGDGSFQVTAQDVSTMMRCEQKSIIFLINNGGYTIEVEIHDGPYNVIKNWNYAAFIDAIHNGEGKCWTAKVTCEKELKAAIETATKEKSDCLCFIDVIVHKDDTSKELLEWGSRVCSANSRPPNAQ